MKYDSVQSQLGRICITCTATCNVYIFAEDTIQGIRLAVSPNTYDIQQHAQNANTAEAGVRSWKTSSKPATKNTTVYGDI